MLGRWLVLLGSSPGEGTVGAAPGGPSSVFLRLEMKPPRQGPERGLGWERRGGITIIINGKRVHRHFRKVFNGHLWGREGAVALPSESSRGLVQGPGLCRPEEGGSWAWERLLLSAVVSEL